jgi:hypothetical protein
MVFGSTSVRRRAAFLFLWQIQFETYSAAKLTAAASGRRPVCDPCDETRMAFRAGSEAAAFLRRKNFLKFFDAGY